jgi:hypothetical protein
MTWVDNPIIDTTGKSVQNTLLELYNECTPSGFPTGGVTRHMEAHNKLVREYSWAIPTSYALKCILQYGPIVEMGAGTGYWAHLLRAMGGDIIAYDKWTDNHDAFGINMWHAPDKQYSHVDNGDPEILVKHKDRTLFLCWPPCDDSMAVDCLKYWKGKNLIYVGEEKGGSTANDKFFKILETEFFRTLRQEIPQWMCANDSLEVWTRK